MTPQFSSGARSFDMKETSGDNPSNAAPDAAETGRKLPPWGETIVVGKPIPRVDGYQRVSGSAVYPHDVILPEMLHAAVLRCPHANALVKKVDAQEAAKMPGVHAVFTSDDPEAKITIPYGWWLGEGPPMYAFDRHCRYAGEEVAAVAAETPNQAWDAVRAIKVEYEELPFVLDVEKALEAGAPKVHDAGNLAAAPSADRRGEVAKGFADAEVVLEETYRTSYELHATMETHGCVAHWEGNRLTVWETSQGVFDQRNDLARALGLPLSAVRVIGHYMGGGFGSKAELSKHTVIASVLSRKSGRPVKLFLTREESFLCVGNRPAHVMTLKAGVGKDGTLTGLKFTNHGAIGAYKESDGGGLPVQALYRCPNVEIEESDIYVHAGKARSMRAPGFPQSAWALEQMMDALADRIGMDPVEFRLRNILSPSQVSASRFTSSGLRECLTEGAKAFGWQEARARAKQTGHVARGVGVAACLWGIEGGPPGTVILKLFPDGSVNLNMGASDIGTGTKTVMAMVVSEELGVPLERIQIEHADTATTQYAQVSGGSHTVAITAPAIRAAAADIKRQLLELAAEELKQPVSTLELKEGKISPIGSPEKGVAPADLKEFARKQELVGIGSPDPNPEGKSVVSFAAHFAEVEVNRRTGEIKVLRFLAAHDSGRVMNRLTYESQVFGGVTMGIGFGLTEARVMDPQTGRVVNANWHDYKIPTAGDVPLDMTCLPVDPHDTLCNTAGAKGLGEPATIPTAPAIANAIYHATGLRVTQAPVTPARILQLMAQQHGGK
jgi:CO/xanthine dehydrogenase Mo-binding subunit